MTCPLRRSRLEPAKESETPIHGTVFEKHDECIEIRQACPRNRNGYRGGNYTYDGHDAIDYTLANFALAIRRLPLYVRAMAATVLSHVRDTFKVCFDGT